MKPAQNLAYDELEPELLEDDPAPKLGWTERPLIVMYGAAILLSAIAVALGTYAWQLISEKRELKSQVAGLEHVGAESRERVAQLVEQNAAEQVRSAQAGGERDELRAALSAATIQLEALRASSAAESAKLAEFQDLRAKFQRMIDSGALDISFRRGRMIVEMPAAVLFDSGSAELSDAGRDTVIRVAKILRSVPRHRFLVGGHTDNVPAVKQYKSNWDLSAARAVRVTETLTSQGLSPKRLVIAGYSEFDPVASNGSETGRQKNRRIEIILEPYVEQKLVEDLLPKSAPARGK
jgi:chemotaxis protein MotB